MLFSRQCGKGDATSHYAARWLRLAAAGGGRKLALLAATVTNCFLHHYLILLGNDINFFGIRFEERPPIKENRL